MEEAEIPMPANPGKKTPLWAKIFAILIVIAMTTWVIAIYVDNADNSGGRKKADFEIAGQQFWILEDGSFATFTDVGGKEVPIAFRLDPREAGNISLDERAITEILSAGKLYLTFNPNQRNLGQFAVAAAEISRIPALYGIKAIGAYTEDSNPINPNVPLKTCADATNTTKVILMQVNNETTQITTNNGCIIVEGATADDLVLAADKLGYNLIGIYV